MSKPTDSGARVMAACLELTRTHHMAQREAIAELAGVSVNIVDIHTRHLCDTGQLIRFSRGVYIHPGDIRDDYPVSVEVLHDGSHKIECGDQIMILSQHFAWLLKLGLGANCLSGRDASMLSSMDGGLTITKLLHGGMLVEVEQDGETKIMELTPREARLLKQIMGGQDDAVLIVGSKKLSPKKVD
jgi:DNA-binding CsgD family transcriptional regulator